MQTSTPTPIPYFYLIAIKPDDLSPLTPSSSQWDEILGAFDCDGNEPMLFVYEHFFLRNTAWIARGKLWMLVILMLKCFTYFAQGKNSNNLLKVKRTNGKLGKLFGVTYSIKLIAEFAPPQFWWLKLNSLDILAIWVHSKKLENLYTLLFE